MKKLILIFTMIFVAGVFEVFASDYREVIFGNNWANIREIENKRFVEICKKEINRFKSEDEKEKPDKALNFYLFEEKYDNGTIFRFIESEKPLTYDNVLKGYEGTGTVIQIVFMEKNKKLYELFSSYVFNQYSYNNCLTKNFAAIDVITRENKIIGLLNHLYFCDSDSKRGYGTFIYWTDLQNLSYYFNENKNTLCSLIRNYDGYVIPQIEIGCSYPLIEEDGPYFRYSLQNAFDGKAETSFVEDSEDNSIFITMYFAHSDLKCKKLKIINGYAENTRLYMANNRVKSIYDNLNKNTVKLNDQTLEAQIVDWSNISVCSKELYKGEKYSDTCIAEIDFLMDSGKWLFGDGK